MKTGLFGALLGCGAVFGWAWSAGQGLPIAEVAATARGVHPSRPIEQLLGTPADRSAVALPAQSISPALLGRTKSTADVEPVTAPSPAAAELLARRYFHAVVVVDELAALLPPEDETHPRTSER